jgi:polysaccharide export outer membrane protein
VKRAVLTFIALTMVPGAAVPGAQAPAPQLPGASTKQVPAPGKQVPVTGTAKPPAGVSIPAGVATPPDYVIGPDDLLTVVFWRDKDMSSDVTVRPDGKISLPLLNDVQASGLTPDQLRVGLTEAAAKFIEEPTVTIVVREIKSRKVFVTGNVGKPGVYPLSAPTTVLQMLATAGGLLEYAKSKNIRIMRTENGKTVSLKFNYKDVSQGKSLQQNVFLKPGDTLIIP